MSIITYTKWKAKATTEIITILGVVKIENTKFNDEHKRKNILKNIDIILTESIMCLSKKIKG